MTIRAVSSLPSVASMGGPFAGRPLVDARIPRTNPVAGLLPTNPVGDRRSGKPWATQGDLPFMSTPAYAGGET